MRRVVALAAPVLLLSACVVGPEPQVPTLPVPEHFSAGAGLATHRDRQTAGPWWQGYADPTLDRLVSQALAESRDLAAAAERVAAAQALLDASRARGGPALGLQAQGSASRSRSGGGGDGRSDDDFDDDRVGVGDNGGGGTRVSAGASAVFSWNPDLFGGRRRARQAAAAEARRQDALRQDLARLTARAVVLGYIELRRAQAQQALLAQAQAAQAQTLELVQLRRRAGLVADTEVLRAESELASQRREAAAAAAATARARHALAVFNARWGPQALPAPASAAVPEYRAPLEPSTPRDLLRRRPDLAAAEANLLRASAEVGVATAALYPNLSLPGSIGLAVTGLGAGEVTRRVVAELSALIQVPLLDGGLRRAEQRAAQARAREALRVYEHTLLLALQQAEDALADTAAGLQARIEARRAADAAEQAYVQTQQRHRAGLVSLLEVLDTQRSWLGSRRAQIDAEADLAAALARLQSAIAAPLIAAEARRESAGTPGSG